MAERGIEVSHESIRCWCNKFGPKYARRFKRRHAGFGDTYYIHEVFVKTDGQQRYLRRAVDQDGEVIDEYVQHRRNGKAAKRFFRRLFKSMKQAQRFLTIHAAVCNVFNLGRHLVSAAHYRLLRMHAMASWNRAAA